MNDRSVIVVTTVGARVTGVIVDAVCDVLQLPRDQVQEVPDLGSSSSGGFVLGVVCSGDRVVSLIDVAGLLGKEGSPAEEATKGIAA